MNKNEKYLISFVFLFVTLFQIYDVYFDLTNNVRSSHVQIQLMAITLSLIGLFSVWKKTLVYQSRLLFKKQQIDQLTEKYKEISVGISSSIDRQFQDWNLTQNEQEIGYLLLKGFSLREIADLRFCAEITVRQQCAKIYHKASLDSRTQFSAFFLEDYLSTAELVRSDSAEGASKSSRKKAASSERPASPDLA